MARGLAPIEAGRCPGLNHARLKILTARLAPSDADGRLPMLPVSMRLSSLGWFSPNGLPGEQHIELLRGPHMLHRRRLST